MGEREEPVVVGAIHNPQLAGAFGAQTHAVLLSASTLVKQKERHTGLELWEYEILPDILRFGLVIQEFPRQLAFCYQHHTGRRYRLTIKSTEDGAQVFVTSLHRTQPRQTRALLRRGLVLRHHA